MAKSIQEIRGDLLTDKSISIIIHQVKTTGKFDGGLAAQIRIRYPLAWAADKLAVEQGKNKLGMFSFAKVGQTKWVFNIYSQSTIGNQMNYTDYSALKNGLVSAKKYITTYLNSPTIGLGHIGTYAGGDWNISRKVVEEAFTDYNGTIKIIYTPGA